MKDTVALCRQYAAVEGNTSYGATFSDAAVELERLRSFVAGLANAKFNLHGADASNALGLIQKQAKEALRNLS